MTLAPLAQNHGLQRNNLESATIQTGDRALRHVSSTCHPQSSFSGDHKTPRQTRSLEFFREIWKGGGGGSKGADLACDVVELRSFNASTALDAWSSGEVCSLQKAMTSSAMGGLQNANTAGAMEVWLSGELMQTARVWGVEDYLPGDGDE
ncbi:hypothetical protein BU16DRAFT_583757 [Lophium mytilinum]|uniref:Uncharacterized protein n=1 Tax=Lophium mytilinum TaxID=390894 RepID=A0A6A6QJS7_9PEZI|nr:hypothetical protein BU16DRAFT_583757 [Lophium mytilinum]